MEAAKKLGAQSYLIKSHASCDDLDRAIQKAIARVEVARKEIYGEKGHVGISEGKIAKSSWQIALSSRAQLKKDVDKWLPA